MWTIYLVILLASVLASRSGPTRSKQIAQPYFISRVTVPTNSTLGQSVIMAPSTRIIDHIPHLTPPGTLQESADAFRKLGFTVVPGGTHTGGETANALVVFSDGTYLELIHFVNPPPSDTTHPWGKKKPGWIDYAFLGTGSTAATDSIAQAINARAEKEGTDVRYEETPGGRKREDGKVLQWLISGTAGNVERGKLPFFCGDVTPRDWRVPLDPPSNIQHANSTVGIAYVKLLVLPEDFDKSVKELTTVLGVQPKTSSASHVVWDLDEQPAHVGVHETAPQLVLGSPGDDGEKRYVEEHGAGIYEVGFVVEDSEKAGGSAHTPCGRLTWKA